MRAWFRGKSTRVIFPRNTVSIFSAAGENSETVESQQLSSQDTGSHLGRISCQQRHSRRWLPRGCSPRPENENEGGRSDVMWRIHNPSIDRRRAQQQRQRGGAPQHLTAKGKSIGKGYVAVGNVTADYWTSHPLK